jgi:predicted 3-demethylubiquinone-9 3-methyltransferase (glyoxalase superfamily)
MQKITPFLWFDNQAEQAAEFYTSIFKNSSLRDRNSWRRKAARSSNSPRQYRLPRAGIVFLMGSGTLTVTFNAADKAMTANESNPAGVSRKEAAIEFLRLAASGEAREAFQKHVSLGFRRHNPFFECMRL